MRIRLMTAEDVPAVAAIEKACFSEPWSEQGFMDGMNAPAVFLNNSGIVLVAEDEEQIAGYIGMYVSEPEGEITNVAVAQSARDRGMGASLVAAMQQWALEHGVERIVLEVRVSNAPAIHVYEKKGFVTIGVRKNFYRLPTEDAGIMEWQK